MSDDNDIARARRKREMQRPNPFTSEGGTVMHDELVKLPRPDRFALIHWWWERGVVSDRTQALLMDAYGYDDPKSDAPGGP